MSFAHLLIGAFLGCSLTLLALCIVVSWEDRRDSERYAQEVAKSLQRGRDQGKPCGEGAHGFEFFAHLPSSYSPPKVGDRRIQTWEWVEQKGEKEPANGCWLLRAIEEVRS